MFSRKFFCVFSCFFSFVLGCADASQNWPEETVPADEGGYDSSDDGQENFGQGNDDHPYDDQCAGADCDEYDPPCWENGKKFECLCGVMLPEGMDVSCGDGGQGQGGSGQGNYGNSGQGNYGNEGGYASSSGTNSQGGCSSSSSSSSSASSSSSSSTSSSSSSSTSSSSTGSSSSSSGSEAGTLGELTVTVVPPASGTHTIIIEGDEWPHRPGGMSWGNPIIQESLVTRKTFTTTIASGSELTFDPVYDPPVMNYWQNVCCDTASMTRTCAMWATYDPKDGTGAKPVAKIAVESNGYGGCHLVAIAAASPLISSSDMDGDGFNPNASNESQRDCNDSANGGQAFFPGQIESPDDMNDLDCNGFTNPARQIIRMSGMSAGLNPTLLDAKTGATHVMTWKSGGVYETAPIEMRFGVSEFVTSWPCSSGTCYDSSYYSGACHELTGGVLSYKDTTNDLLSVSLQIVGGYTCHRFIDTALLKP